MSHFLYNERCPKCSANGADKSGNNLAVYSDTHKYCFACGYIDKGDIVERFKTKLNTKVEVKPFTQFNNSGTMDSKGMTYLKKFGLTNDEINKNYFWDSDGYLVFDGGSYQNARNFTGVGAKYMTRGVIRCRAVQAAPKARVSGFLKLFMCRKPFFCCVSPCDRGRHRHG